MSDHQLTEIITLFTCAEAEDIPLWLESGWAIDARLGRVTREHEDIDVAYPKEREDEYLHLLRELGYGCCEQTDYGFLLWKGTVLLDTEPCVRTDVAYGFPGFPAGACPAEKEGILQGYPIRCLSWEAIYWEFLYYINEVPQEQWREKDFISLQIIEANLTEGRKEALKAMFIIR